MKTKIQRSPSRMNVVVFNLCLFLLAGQDSYQTELKRLKNKKATAKNSVDAVGRLFKNPGSWDGEFCITPCFGANDFCSVRSPGHTWQPGAVNSVPLVSPDHTVLLADDLWWKQSPGCSKGNVNLRKWWNDRFSFTFDLSRDSFPWLLHPADVEKAWMDHESALGWVGFCTQRKSTDIIPKDSGN